MVDRGLFQFEPDRLLIELPRQLLKDPFELQMAIKPNFLHHSFL